MRHICRLSPARKPVWITYLFYILGSIKFNWPQRAEDQFKVKCNLYLTLYLISKCSMFWCFVPFNNNLFVCTFNLQQRYSLKCRFHYQIISKLFTLKLQLQTFEWGVCTNEIVKLLFAKSSLLKELYV